MTIDNPRGRDRGVAGAAGEFVREEILGARQWRRSKIASLTGAASIIDAAKSAKNMGSDSLDRVGTLYSAAFHEDTGGVAVPEDGGDERQRFLLAMRANGRSQADIARSVEVTYFQFWLYAALLAATFVLGFFTFPALDTIQGPVGFLLSVLFRLCPLPLLGALILRAGWTNWAFRRFRLDGVGKYLKAGHAMLPRKTLSAREGSAKIAAGKARQVVKRVGLVMAIGLGTMIALHAGATPALAQSADVMQQGSANANQVFSDPKSSDLFMQLMSYVIPNAGPIPNNPLAGNMGPYKVVRDGLAAFAATLLFIGMLMSGWQIISGIVASAKEGTAIGRNYHEVWAPVRTVIGYGMLVPVANGLCGAQLLCLYLIAWGGNLANLVWSPYVSGTTNVLTDKNAQTLQATALRTSGSSIANVVIQSIYEKELCRATVATTKLRNYVWYSSAAPDSVSFQKVTQITNFAQNDIYKADYGTICGSVELEVPKQTTSSITVPASANTANLPSTVGVSTSALDTSYENSVKFQLGQKRLAAVQALQGKLAQMATTAAATYQPGTASNDVKYFSDGGGAYTNNDGDKIGQLKKEYVDALAQAIQDIDPKSTGQQLVNQMTLDAQQAGWAKAGVYYLTMARISGGLYGALYGGLKASPITPESATAVSDYLAGYLFSNSTASGIVPGILPQFRIWWFNTQNSIAGDASANLTKAGSNSVTEWMSSLFMSMGSWFMHLDVNPLDPMSAMIAYGDFLMRTGTEVIGAMLLIKSGAGLIGKVPLIGGVAKAAAGVVTTIAGDAFEMLATPAMLMAFALIMAGAIHSYIIPFLPYIMTVMFVAGMLILTVESLVAAPLWAFFHIRLDGQEFIDQVQKPGYMIAFNLLLRPVLMIFGLIMSMLVFGAMSWFINETFMPAANGLAASTTVGPIGAITLVVILAFMNLNVASKSFHLITEVPDRVARWFGHGGEHLNERNETDQLKGIITGAVAGRGESMIQNGVTGAIARGQNRKAARDAAAQRQSEQDRNAAGDTARGAATGAATGGPAGAAIGAAGALVNRANTQGSDGGA